MGRQDPRPSGDTGAFLGQRVERVLAADELLGLELRPRDQQVPPG